MTAAQKFEAACETLQAVLQGATRSDILDHLCAARTLKDGLVKLRSSIRTHCFKTQRGELHLSGLVRDLDERTQSDGFHVLIDWDGKANRWLEEMIPIDVLDYYARGVDPARIGRGERQSLSILLDYYFLYLVALLAMRVADGEHVSDNVERVNQLILDLQGPSGSGQQSVEDAGTLVLMATSHFEPEEAAYARLIGRIRTTWNEAQQLEWAIEQSAVLGSHLRHGFQDLYMRDVGLMRADNTSDYPCLCVALLTLMRGYAAMHDSGAYSRARERVVEALLNGLTPDPRALLAKRPASLENYAKDQSEFASLFRTYSPDLFTEFHSIRPSERKYSALSFSFNFPHNVLKGIVIDALFKREPNRIPMGRLLSGSGTTDDGREALARTLMSYSRRAPDKIGGRSVPVILYDPALGLRTFVKTVGLLRELVN